MGAFKFFYLKKRINITVTLIFILKFFKATLKRSLKKFFYKAGKLPSFFIAEFLSLMLFEET
jgi:hypothetical protein